MHDHQKTRQLVSLFVAAQHFGVRIEAVRDILGAQQLAKVPLATPEIAGVLNLRGRIVTAIDLRRRLGMEKGQRQASDTTMNIVVDHQGELYSLLVDRVGDVLTLATGRFEADAGSLPPRWRGLAHGIFRLDDGLLIELDVDRILALQAAA